MIRFTLINCYTRQPETQGVLSPTTVEYLRRGTFLAGLSASNLDSAIEQMLGALANHSEVIDLGALREAVFERQKVNPPLLSNGIAFPHARTNSVRSLVLVVAALAEPILVGETVLRLLFLIGVPKAGVSEYLELTSFLARHLRLAGGLERLTCAANMTQLIEAFGAS
jgi:mannitol/fructose-specific phosphotransferase system IIA component (Ntr-type)